MPFDRCPPTTFEVSAHSLVGELCAPLAAGLPPELPAVGLWLSGPGPADAAALCAQPPDPLLDAAAAALVAGSAAAAAENAAALVDAHLAGRDREAHARLTLASCAGEARRSAARELLGRCRLRAAGPPPAERAPAGISRLVTAALEVAASAAEAGFSTAEQDALAAREAALFWSRFDAGLLDSAAAEDLEVFGWCELGDPPGALAAAVTRVLEDRRSAPVAAPSAQMVTWQVGPVPDLVALALACCAFSLDRSRGTLELLVPAPVAPSVARLSTDAAPCAHPPLFDQPPLL